MIALRRILVPTDFSETANAALRYGDELARAHEATVHVLHVVTEPQHESWISYAPGWEYMNLVEQLKVNALKQLELTLAAQHASSLPVVLETAHGEAATEILRYAAERDIDLIVCGTHGRTGWNRLVMGSVAEAVVREAPCPVLTVQHHQREFVVADAATLAS